MNEKQIEGRMKELPEEQQRMVLATIRGMELANEANKTAQNGQTDTRTA